MATLFACGRLISAARGFLSIIDYYSFIRVVRSEYSSVSLGKRSVNGMITSPKNKRPSRLLCQRVLRKIIYLNKKIAQQGQLQALLGGVFIRFILFPISPK